MKKFFGDMQAAWKNTSPGARKKNKIFLVMVISIFGFFAYILFFAGSGPTSSSSTVGDINTPTRVANVDRTEALSTLDDPAFEAQLREVARRRAESAAQDGSSHITDVSYMNWDAMSPNDIVPYALDGNGEELTARQWNRLANSEKEQALRRYAEANGFVAGALNTDGSPITKRQWAEMTGDERAEAMQRFEDQHGFRIGSLECNCDEQFFGGALDSDGNPITAEQWARMSEQEKALARARYNQENGTTEYVEGVLDAQGNPIRREDWANMSAAEREQARQRHNQEHGTSEYVEGALDAQGNPIRREDWANMSAAEREQARGRVSTGSRDAAAESVRRPDGPEYVNGALDQNGNPITHDAWESMTDAERERARQRYDYPNVELVPDALDVDGNPLTTQEWELMSEDERREAKLRYAAESGYVPGALDADGNPISEEQWQSMSEEERLAARARGRGIEPSEALGGLLHVDCTAVTASEWEAMSRNERRGARDRFRNGCEASIATGATEVAGETRRLSEEQYQAVLTRKVNAVTAMRQELTAAGAGSDPQPYERTPPENTETNSDWGDGENASTSWEEDTVARRGGFVPGDKLIGYTTMDTNSDTSSYVEVKIASGPLRGATVGLTPQRVEEYIVMGTTNITFNRRTASISAIAIDPQNGMSDAFSSRTDHHLLARYGSAFMAGAFGTVVDFIGRQGTQVQSGNTGSIVAETRFSTDDLLISGLTGGGAEVASDLNSLVRNRPPTVYVDAGQRVVLVITEPQEIEWLPEPYTIQE